MIKPNAELPSLSLFEETRKESDLLKMPARFREFDFTCGEAPCTCIGHKRVLRSWLPFLSTSFKQQIVALEFHIAAGQ